MIRIDFEHYYRHYREGDRGGDGGLEEWEGMICDLIREGREGEGCGEGVGEEGRMGDLRGGDVICVVVSIVFVDPICGVDYCVSCDYFCRPDRFLSIRLLLSNSLFCVGSIAFVCSILFC